MRPRLVAIVLLSAVMSLSQIARAQDSSPEPIIRLTVDPPRVVVGRPTTLRIVILAPNYMTSPPELPGFQVRNAVTRQLQSLNISEQHNGMTFAGVRFEYALYPQEPGSYAIADQNVRIRYAAEPPATREVTVALPRIAFEAFIPEAAAELRPFLSAVKLNIGQIVNASSDRPKVGDSLTRTVTIKAEGTPAMLLPPQRVAAIEGLRPYPAQPVLEDKTEVRTGVMTSTRVDSVIYILERSGDYSLPAIDIRWWNAGGDKVELAHIDAVSLHVDANPEAETTSADIRPSGWTWEELIDIAADHWLVVIAVSILLAGVAWLAPAATRRMTSYLRRRRAAYLESEAYAFRQWRASVRHRDAGATYDRLLGWLQRFGKIASVATISDFASQDAVLKQQLDAIEIELYGPTREQTNWSPRKLLRHASLARSRLRRQSVDSRDTEALPQQLNPVEPQGARFKNRKVAR